MLADPDFWIDDVREWVRSGHLVLRKRHSCVCCGLIGAGETLGFLVLNLGPYLRLFAKLIIRFMKFVIFCLAVQESLWFPKRLAGVVLLAGE